MARRKKTKPVSAKARVAANAEAIRDAASRAIRHYEGSYISERAAVRPWFIDEDELGGVYVGVMMRFDLHDLPNHVVAALVPPGGAS